ncbi:MAG: Heme oxygenase [Luteibacter sp.]|uniref:biliverdin-producing heme oxygenase n=1 Tax=Luteibacter sp. TaxID=1886636 RepID=UPI0013806AFD|nr:biliverdin-producing heme oxygenase [Luteibacter sp.]KAF1009603.1 MAG: Heme oxygenase [Luteibacter sp.]
MPGVAEATPAHRFLREQTRDAHEAAEATTGMRRLMDGQLDAEGYRALLGAQLALFRRWEGERGEWLEAIRDRWHYASRATPLETDLCRSASCARSTIATSGHRAQARSYNGSEPSYWGELYVIEGSSLGARVIVKRLRAMFPDHPHHYYAMGETSPTDWRRFQATLDNALPDDNARRQALDGACAMFARFQQTLEDPVAHV